MYKRETTVINVSGIHARPASRFIEEAKKFSSKIKIQNLDYPAPKPANAKSIVSVLGMVLNQGTNIEISAEGDDEVQAVDALIELVDSGLGE